MIGRKTKQATAMEPLMTTVSKRGLMSIGNTNELSTTAKTNDMEISETRILWLSVLIWAKAKKMREVIPKAKKGIVTSHQPVNRPKGAMHKPKTPSTLSTRKPSGVRRNPENKRRQ